MACRLAPALLLSAGLAWSASPGFAAPTPAPPFSFTDTAPELGLARYRWRAAMRDAKIIGTVGGGAAWGDYDGDGDLDVWLTQGVRRPDRPGPEDCGRLLRNDGATFVDVTAAAGGAGCGWGMGALWEDLDGDGALDLLLTGLDLLELWLGTDRGTLRPAPASGLGPAGWTTGAAAPDLDGDGDLDLYVSRYLATDFQAERQRPLFSIVPIDTYPPLPDLVFENHEAGHFRERPGAATAPPGRGLAVVAADLDGDLRPEVYVANDRHPNTLYTTTGHGLLSDVTELAGVGLGTEAQAAAGMGVAVGDADGNGLPDLLVSNFAAEAADLYRNLGDLVFEQASHASGLATASWDTLGWATALADFDADGDLDAFLANGHLVPRWVRRLARWTGHGDPEGAGLVGPYRQPSLFLAAEDGRLRPVAVAAAGRPGVWRGGGAVDVDLDGRLDVFLYASDWRTPTRLLRNDTAGGGWLGARLRRPGGRPWPPGTRVAADAPGRRPVVGQVVSGGSYLGGDAGPVHLGLGSVAVTELAVAGPDRAIRFRDLPAGRYVVLAARPTARPAGEAP